MHSFLNSVLQAAIDDIDSILGTTEENKQNPATLPTKSPQLHAPRPKEMQRILQEHQQQMHAIEKDKKEMEEEKEKQRLAEEHRRTGQVEERIQTDSAPPPSPAAAMSPVGSTALLEETPLTTRPDSVVSGASNVHGLSEGNHKTTKPEHTSPDGPVPQKSNETTDDLPHPLREGTGSQTEDQAQKSFSPRPDASHTDNDDKRERASSLRTEHKPRTPSPREGRKGKRGSSAKD